MLEMHHAVLTQMIGNPTKINGTVRIENTAEAANAATMYHMPPY
jgi:hypothetical protein